jgi:hypothetical protein
MPLISCLDCGKAVSTSAPACPHCGRPMDAEGAAYAAPVRQTSPGPSTGSRGGAVVKFILAVTCFVLFFACIATAAEKGKTDNAYTASTNAGTSTPDSSLALRLAAAQEALGQQWLYTADADAMTSKITRQASILSTNTVTFDFPYTGAQRATLTLRRHPRYGKDVIVQIEKGQILCDSWDGCTVLVRFDDGAAQTFSANPAEDNSREMIFISNYARFLAGLRKAKTVSISFSVYQEGSPIFTFNTERFDIGQLNGTGGSK